MTLFLTPPWPGRIVLGAAAAVLVSVAIVVLRAIAARPRFWNEILAPLPGQPSQGSRYILLVGTVGLGALFLDGVIRARTPEALHDAIAFTNWLDVNQAVGVSSGLYLLNKLAGGSLVDLFANRSLGNLMRRF